MEIMLKIADMLTAAALISGASVCISSLASAAERDNEDSGFIAALLAFLFLLAALILVISFDSSKSFRNFVVYSAHFSMIAAVSVGVALGLVLAFAFNEPPNDTKSTYRKLCLVLLPGPIALLSFGLFNYWVVSPNIQYASKDIHIFIRTLSICTLFVSMIVSFLNFLLNRVQRIKTTSLRELPLQRSFFSQKFMGRLARAFIVACITALGSHFGGWIGGILAAAFSGAIAMTTTPNSESTP